MECRTESGEKIYTQYPAILNVEKKSFILMNKGGLHTGLVIYASLRENTIIVQRCSSRIKRVILRVGLSNSLGFKNEQREIIDF